MVRAKSDQELTYMKQAGKIVALAHQAVKKAIIPGISTKELNKIVEDVIVTNGATPSFKGLYGFPTAACISVNTVLVHGIPDETKLSKGDIVSIDIGACYHGYHGDSAWTYAVEAVSEETEKLLRLSEESLYEGLKMAKPGNHITDISHAIGEFVFSHFPLQLSIIGVFVFPGDTALTRMPCLPNSAAKLLVKLTTPAFDAQ